MTIPSRSISALREMYPMGTWNYTTMIVGVTSPGLGAGNYDLYDYGNCAHVSLQINGNQFQGYDYDKQCHFSGSVSGNSVTLYDNGESRHFNYIV
jgi:hypothetical protein